ncbi:type II toxin-antitoxin system RelE/ParE family toxin [Alloscardovia macacae]|uniref:Addiction module killer protein n=1 Tax=Alloscardovia macacae TaxID=1160091 RepID=A0A261F465_9BIFI|nr:type II toxin-antitoxin system RelE/ParE family toxin [Alloscardovia macacae]OZG53865.1 addiction module killer protein [Alloscardovia macacae]
MEIFETDEFTSWLTKLKDRKARARIIARFDAWQASGRISGDIKPIKNGVYEARFTFGPGYRVYYAHKQNTIILLLIGGDKSSQSKDIKKAQDLLHDLTKKGEWS